MLWSEIYNDMAFFDKSVKSRLVLLKSKRKLIFQH